MKNFLLCSLALALFFPAYPQMQDHIWLGGYNPSAIDTPPFAEFRLAFTPTGPQFTPAPRVANLAFHTSICDPQGNLLFYTNGLNIYNALDDTLQNGVRIVTDTSYTFYNPGAEFTPGAVALDFPGNDSIYYLINCEFSYPGLGYGTGLRTNATKINMHAVPGGAVVQKNLPVILDTIAALSLDACRHANGRDWWVIVPTVQNDTLLKGYRRLLVTPQGVSQQDSVQFTGSGYNLIHAPVVRFSPDGTRFALHSLGGILIWDFDRTTGLLSNGIVVPDICNISFDLEFSPNSRYLYALSELITGWRVLHQYDLHATNIQASVQTIDSTHIGFPGSIYDVELTPDGKIYGTLDSFYHIIHHPNLGGAACSLQKQAIQLPMYVGTFPHFPHYRLGSLPESIADSLGLPATYALMATAKITQPIRCAGDSGAVAAVPTGGVPGYRYLWNTGDTTATLTGLPPGTYTCAVTDSFGSSYSVSVSLPVLTALAAVPVTTDNTSLSGNGTASAAVAGGVFPYTFLWSTGDTTPGIDSVFSGTYSCTIMDSNGCVTSLTAQVGGIPAGTQAPQITAPILCAGASTGAVALTPTPGFSYLWNTGATTPALAGLPAGTYSCTVTDTTGASYLLSVTLTDPTPVTLVMASVTNFSAEGNGSAAAIPSGGTPPYTYLWNTGAVTDSIGGLFKGIYTCTVTDANGCQATGSTNVDGIAVGLDAEWKQGICITAYAENIFLIHNTLPNARLTFILADGTGKSLLPQVIEAGSSVLLDLRSLPAGMYLWTADGEGFRAGGKLITLP